MKGKPPDTSQFNLYRQQLENLINPGHPLCKLAKRIPWHELERHFADLYHHSGRPAKPIRLMVSLLILKQLYNLSDETIVERCVENPYFQFFSGESVFQWNFPCHLTDLVYFRKRISEEGVEKIFQVSIELHGKRAKEKEVLVDTTLQEKNGVLSELMEEHVSLKKSWGTLNNLWVESDTRDGIVDFINRWSACSGIPAFQIISWIGTLAPVNFMTGKGDMERSMNITIGVQETIGDL